MPGPYHPLVEEEKQIIGFAGWSDPDPSDRAISFLVPLDVGGVTVEGLYLRARTNEQSLDRDVLFQLELAPSGSRTRIPLIRAEWRPRAPQHKNPDQSIISGSHLHPFAANWLEQEQRMRAGNLPYAVEIPPDINDFPKLLDFTGKKFRISNMASVPVPPWTMTLFS